MKLFIASDLHGSLPATEKVLSLFEQSEATTLVLLGDLLNHGPRNPIPEGYNPAAVAEQLNHYANKIVAVRGNCDSEVDQMLLTFPMMSDYAWVMLESGQRMFLTHGHLYNQQNCPAMGPRDILVHGHTHIPSAQEWEKGFFLNPGSVTFPRNDFAPSYGLLEGNQLIVKSLDGDEMLAKATI
ncbi:phosphodiesterase [Vibrio diazotrophicus]|uniref:phosphodiesterase n=1 Tax=Vibrio diazotrophicus TaxID=685 RepID=UPI00142DB07E|nr:phosphodiesterase [Vibrio diazotrophicus]NIY91741.1 phosphodiesterase [Vibrio diazotrophicus]